MEITINSDSSYTWNNWDVGYKKNWPNYKLYEPSTNKGIINRKGNYFILTKYRNGIKTDYGWTVKISKNRIRFYYFNELGKLKMGAKYKRIYLDKNETHNHHFPFTTN